MLAQGESRWSTPLSSLNAKSLLAEELARSMVAGPAGSEAVAARCAETLGRAWKWIAPMAVRFAAAYDGKTRPRRREAAAFLLQDRGFRRALRRYSGKLRVESRFVGEACMQPVAAALEWDVPAIASVAELADWVGLRVGELEWFADLRGYAARARSSEQLTHYNYHVTAKRSGGVRFIESPKERLKETQRRILRGILERVPIHPSAHGFVRERSIKTFAEPHTGKAVVLRMDLMNFFPSIRGVRVQTIFRTMGYPEAVADLLGGLCTNAVPGGAWRALGVGLEQATMRELRETYAAVHLPQGAPTSPTLANLCGYRMDCRLRGLAEAAGAVYTRYADDLAFSRDAALGRSASAFLARVAAIAMEEGFDVNHRKTRVMRKGARQELAGLVVNRHLGVKRTEFDALKAILTNCVRRGPERENREGLSFFRAHLEGRVGFVESIQPERGRRLRVLLERIEWGN